MKKYLAEFTGTFALIFIGGGAAVFAHPWIGYIGISLAFGLVLTSMTAAFQDVSGGFFNPATALACFLSDNKTDMPRFRKLLDFGAYVSCELAGGLSAAFLLKKLYLSKMGFVGTDVFAANITTKYPVSSALILEFVLTFLFLCVFLATSKKEKTKIFTPFVAGLMTTACYMVAMPVTKASLNPVRSTSMALFGWESASPQLWIFWAAPCLAAVFAGLFFRDYSKKSK